MLERTRRLGGGLLARLATVVYSVVLAGTGWAEDTGPSSTHESVPSTPGERLELWLTRAELQSIIRKFEIKSGQTLTGPIDDEEVIVVAPVWQAPMRDVSQDVGGGIVAPFWAIMHPKDAWRIFVPIPPKRPKQESEPPVPDPR